MKYVLTFEFSEARGTSSHLYCLAVARELIAIVASLSNMLLNDSRWLLEALLTGIAWQFTRAWRSEDIWPGEGRQGWQLNGLMNAGKFRRRWSLDDHRWSGSGQRIVLLLISLKSFLLNLLLVLVGNLALCLVVLTF